jgi:Flp pilus assembly protein TadD
MKLQDKISKANDTELLLIHVQALMDREQWRDAIKLLKRNVSTIDQNWELQWHLGWCYFKLEQISEAQKYLTKALHLAPNRFLCKFGLGMVYLEKNQYKKAEPILSEALDIKKGHHLTRIGLALAYLGQGKIEQAEKLHLEGIKLKPKDSARYESYAAFLSDVGREAEAKKASRKAKELRRIN